MGGTIPWGCYKEQYAIFEDEVLPQFSSLVTVRNQELDDAVADIRTHRLSRVDSGSYNYVPLVELLIYVN